MLPPHHHLSLKAHSMSWPSSPSARWLDKKLPELGLNSHHFRLQRGKFCIFHALQVESPSDANLNVQPERVARGQVEKPLRSTTNCQAVWPKRVLGGSTVCVSEKGTFQFSQDVNFILVFPRVNFRCFFFLISRTYSHGRPQFSASILQTTRTFAML